MKLNKILENYPLILAECAISERVRRETTIELHPSLFLTPLIYDTQGAKIMAGIYGQYRVIAEEASLPILLCAPTWRIDQPRIEAAGYDDTLLFDAVRYMRDLHKKWYNPNSPLILGGLLAPKNDCYSPHQAPDAEEAEKYHHWQIERLIVSNVDCIVAQTIPAVSEGLGIAQACSSTGTPYIISFVTNPKGEVLDSTPLAEAITTIDENVSQPPLGYMVNCVYPTFVCAQSQPQQALDRLIGIQANSSSLDHEQLDGSAVLHQDDIEHWGDAMLLLNEKYGIQILGGCCGTDDSYLHYLVEHCYSI
ncbi:MAG: homocysteine S-methyltransferase family protein [Desulfocapsaceae bacterium]|nr:homocysteine S-methyltransferase family protein [Desulfocapsaceae bacterium]